MKLQELDMTKFIPLFMRDDECVKAMASAVNDIVSHIDANKLRTWDQLDKMTGDELDELAWELNVLWYNAAGTLEQKREQIRTSDDVWRTLGTRHAVETVISQLFVKGKLLEFWEYEGGKPHHFMVECYDPNVLTPDGEKEFRRILEIVKRKSQILDSIVLVLTPNFWTYTGVAYHECTREWHGFPDIPINPKPDPNPPASDVEPSEDITIAVVDRAIAGETVAAYCAGVDITDTAVTGAAVSGYAVMGRDPAIITEI